MTENDVLAWYEGRERALNRSYVDRIAWHEVKKHPVPPELLPVIAYMSKVEKLTEVYYQELRRTPTKNNPVIRRFLDRWSTEETLHGDLLARFLGEAGLPYEPGWYEKVKSEIPLTYKLNSMVLTPIVAHTAGRRGSFEAVHMVWGAINEYSTLGGYLRLMHMAKHPVLSTILRGIISEEGRHAQFYWKIARLKLTRSGYSRWLSRFIIDRFWTPVGQGARPKQEAEMCMRVLFPGPQGVEHFDDQVSGYIRKLPGFEDCTTITSTVSSVILHDPPNT